MITPCPFFPVGRSARIPFSALIMKGRSHGFLFSFGVGVGAGLPRRGREGGFCCGLCRFFFLGGSRPALAPASPSIEYKRGKRLRLACQPWSLKERGFPVGDGRGVSFFYFGLAFHGRFVYSRISIKSQATETHIARCRQNRKKDNHETENTLVVAC